MLDPAFECLGGGLRGEEGETNKVSCFKDLAHLSRLVDNYLAVSRHARSTGDTITSSFSALHDDPDKILPTPQDPACDSITKVFFSMGYVGRREESSVGAQWRLKSTDFFGETSSFSS